MSNLTRIKNNQITDSTILANVKIVPGSIVGSLFNSNLTMTSDVTITGNLTVQGSSTYLTLASTNTYVNDPLIVMNNAFAGTNTYDIGFLFNRGNQTNQAIIWNEDSDEFRLIATNETGTTFGNIAATSWAKLHLGDFDSEGSATFANVDVTAAFTGVGLTLSGDLGVNGGDFTSNAATFNLLTADVTTINAFTAATTANIGAGTGTFTINTPTIVGQQATQNLYNTVATTMNFAGAATTLNLGANSGLLALNNANIWVPNATSIDGAQATVDLLRNATTVSAFTSASTANIGAGTGTLTINNPTVVGQQTSQNLYNSVATTMNFAGDATALNLGATSGTAQIKNANLYLPNATTIYTGQTTVDFAAATTTLNIGAATGTTNVKNNLDVDLTLNARDINNTVIGNVTPAIGKFTSVYSTALTEGRVVFTGSGNVLADASQLTYDTGTWQLSVGPIYIYGGGNGIGTTSGDLNITPAGNIIASNNSIKWMLDPVDAQDAVTLSYLQTSLNTSVTQIISDNTDVVITDDGVSSGVITANVDGVHVLAVTSNSAAFFGNTSADSLIFANDTTGNVAVMGDLYVQDDLTVASGGQVSILDTTASTDTTTGALKVTGGAGIGGNLNVGANLFVVSDTTIAGAVKFSNTADATNSTTGGALTVSGGLAVAKNVFIGQSLEITGNLTVQGTTTTLNTATLDVEDLNITVAKGAASSAAADGAGLTVDGANATLLYTDGTSSWDLNKITRVTATTAATDNVTGALQILGGAGIAKSLYARDINATVIGNTSAAAGTFTALTSSGTTQLGLTSATAINNTPIGNATASSGAFTTLDASGIVQFTDASAATSVGTGALRVTGGASVGGNLYVGGNINIVGNTFTLTGNTGVFYGDINGFGALYAGVTGYTSLPQTVLQTQGDYNGYIQNNFENVNTGSAASTDWVATAGDGSDVDHYIDMGITTVNWNGTQDNSITNAVGPNDGYLYVQGNVTTGQGGNLTIGASTPGTKKVSILAGGNTASSISAVFTNPGTPSTNTTTGALTLVGGLGVLGNINANNISATTLTGTLSTASQPNVTSLGTLSSLSVSGVLTAGNTAVASLTMSTSGNANITGVNDLSTQTVTASGNISAGNVSATYFTGTLLTAAQPNVTSLGNLTSLSASGTIETTGIVYGNSGVGGTLLTAAQPNVTSLGNLTSLSASGTIETIGTIYANSTAVSYSSATGALVVAGGVGLGANLNVHGGAVINIDNTLEPFQVKGKYANTLIYADSVTDTVTIGGGNTTPINGATLRVNGTGAMVVPKGTTSERPGTAGNVDVAGMVRFNTSTNILEYYTGSAWQNTSTDFTVIAVDAFTGNGAQTNFTLAAASTTAGALVAINGVVQIPTTSYSISGNVLSFTEAPAVGDEIDVRRYTTSKTVTEVLFLYNGFQANASHATVSTGTSSYNPRILVDTSGKTTFAGDVEKQGDVINNQTVTNIPLSAAAVVVDQFSTGTYTSAKYLAQVKDGATNAAHIFDLLVIHDTSTANLLVVSSHNTGSSLGSFTANIQSGTVKLWYTSASVTNSNVRVAATYVK